MTPLSPEVLAELAKLHDIHLPASIGWWPLAPGWWGLAALMTVLAIGFTAFEMRRRRTVRFAALGELAALKAKLAEPGTARDLAVLLRRLLLAGPGAPQTTTISGADWAARLTQGRGGLSAPVAAFISNAPYARPDADGAGDQTLLAQAIAEADTWIRRQ